ncbi:MAG: PAS domain-containing protein [Acidobacteria bacterium]|nr:PAS domain-containing protein [Acidobacteriota bacterium]
MSDAARQWRLVRAVARHDQMAELLPEFHQQALRVSGGRVSVIIRFNPRTQTLQGTSAAGLDELGPEPWLADTSGQAAAERTWAGGSPLFFQDLSDLPTRLGASGALLVPLLSGGDRIGLLIIGGEELDRGDAVDAEVAVVGDLLSVALERAKRQRDADLQQDLRELAAELARSVSSSLHLNASLEVFCDRASRLFTADHVSVWLHDRRARTLDLAASSNAAEVANRQRLGTDDTTVPVSRVLRGIRAEVVASMHHNAPDVLVPLKGRRRALGTLELRGVRIDAGDEIDLLDRLEEVGRQLSAAIENVWLLEDVLRSRRELESTFNSLADLVFVSDSRTLRVTHANQAVATRLGRRAADLIEHPLAEFFGPDLVNWVAQLGPGGGQIATGYESREFEDPVLKGTFLFTVSPLIGRDDERIGHVIVARDVTDHARLEAERVELRDRLTQSEKLAALGQFVAGIAHELNNPLQGVIGHVELLLQSTGPGTTRFKRDLKLVFREADRAAKIVHNLLVFAGSRRITRRRLNVNHVVTKVLALRATACAAARIDVTKVLAVKLPRIAGDALLLQQAVLNIVVNAEQALASVPEPRRLEIRTRTALHGIEIRIADNGTGISAEALPRLFEPFFTTKEVGQGTGLGLAIAYGIVQEHAGELHAANRPEGGAAFTIELPSESEAVE